MSKNYLGLWLILICAFVAFAATSVSEDFHIGSYKPKSSRIAQTMGLKEPQVSARKVKGAASRASQGRRPDKAVTTDTTSKTILFIGDSMLEGLSPRLAHYAKHNGHKLYTVIWYSSTSEIWGNSNKLASYIKQIKPNYIFICLGANELFVRDIITKRDKYVKKILKDIGNIPYIWIGPPNWKPDTGINDLIASNTRPGCYFKSDGMHFDRAKDGAHPTRSSAILWMDSIARWMPRHAEHPIKMNYPKDKSGRPIKIYVHQPSER